VDYLADGGDDDDDEEESSKDDEEDDMDVEANEEEEEEEHPAPADSVVRLLAISSPPASPLSPWSSPPPHIPFPPLPPILSPPSPVLSPAPPPSPIRSLGYRAAMIRLRDEAASTFHSPPLQLPSASRREDKPEVTLPPRKRLDIALGPRYEVGESSSAAARPAGGFRTDYGFVATIDREIMRDLEREVGYGITDSWDEIVETLLLAISSPPASPLSHWSSPPPQIPFPPLPPILSPPSPVLSPAPPPSPIRSLGYRAAMIRLRDEAASTSHSPPLQLPSASRREDIPEVALPPQKRLDIALGPRYEVGESSSFAATRPAGGFRADYGFVATVDREIMRDPEREVGYGITDSWDKIVETLHGAPVSTDTELGGYVREFETRVRQDTDEIYMRWDDEQTERQLLAGQLNMLFRDRRAHAYTHQLMETEARMSREAWMSEIRELQAADRKRQTVISELLRIDHMRSTKISELRIALQGQVTAL
nr:hypothetical protein [Tanacetum cinerariifolium]